jgi:exonuclease SbcC
VIRSRYRNQVSTLEFQAQTPNGFRSLTGRSMRATQQLLIQQLRLDYDTFVNSAYLRQGRADEFMLKRPSERKQILADLLKLDQYDDLAEQAKERSRQCKAEIGVLERNLDAIAAQLQQSAGLAIEQERLTADLTEKQQQQDLDAEALRQLQSVQQQRHTWQQQLNLHQQQQRHLAQDCQRCQQELAATQHHLKELEALLQQTHAITQGYTQFQQLQAEDEAQTQRFQAQQALLAKRQHLQQQQTEELNAIKDQLRQAQAQLDALHQQQHEIQHVLHKADDVDHAMEHLRVARAKLTELDHLQTQVAPLLQRRQEIQSTLDRLQTRLTARLEELQSTADQLQQQQQRQPQLHQAVLEISAQVEYLEKRRVYLQKVREKGLERRNFMERLQAHQRNHELKLGELNHKIAMLTQEAVGGWGVGCGEATANGQSTDQTSQEQTIQKLNQILHPTPHTSHSTPHAPYPPCPLCDRPLDEHHWNLVLEKHQAEQKDIQDQIWVIREQLVVSEREIKVLRQEYRDVEKELASYGPVLERRGQLQEQLQGTTEGQQRLQQVLVEQENLRRSLQTGEFAPDLHEELRLLDQTLQQLSYDDKNHALARGEVDRWRWAEIKQAEIKQAQRRHAQIAKRQPELEVAIAELEHQLASVDESPLQQQIDQINHHICEIGYDVNQHTVVRNELRQAQVWQLRYQELAQAQQHYPLIQQRTRELGELLATRAQALQTVEQQIQDFTRQLAQVPDRQSDIQALEHQMQRRRTQLDEYIAYLGRLQQQQQQLDRLHQQADEHQKQLQTLRRQGRVYQELAQAFGKNGIQALMIENVLPQLEAEANRILGQLSANQLHVQFVTQRAGRRKGKMRHTDKLIDTLDILIADVQGTRPYETYSGGEAFRVNFAIRLALAQLLAQRSGTALQMLIVDEGFGTQDEAGCDRLISAINAIASDFACILTVTHMPHFKEAFQARIEVQKTVDGSKLSLSI